jgi:hypothetical protein
MSYSVTELTAVANEDCIKMNFGKTFCVVHHTRAPPNVTEDNYDHRAQARFPAWTAAEERPEQA